MRVGSYQKRIAWVAGSFAAIFLVCAFRIADMGYLSSERYLKAARAQRDIVVALPSDRGRIIDRNGASLAISVESVAIDVYPSVGAVGPVRLDGVADVLGRTPYWVAERVEQARSRSEDAKRSMPVSLRFDATPSQARAVSMLGIEGIVTQPTRSRLYPHGPLAGQLIGFAAAGGGGQAGIEKSYEHFLHSKRPTVPAQRGGKLQYGFVYPVGYDYARTAQGATVQLTIDAPLQRVVDDSLAATLDQHGAESGVAIVMDVTTGEVLAMGSAPLFDPNDRQLRGSAAERNRAIHDRFEPGSTMKTFLAAAAIEAGVAWPEKQIYCENGSFRVGRFRISDHKRYGWLSFADVMRYSSNIGVAKVAADLGSERLGEALRAFGLGGPTGIDLADEISSVLPAPGAWPLTTLTTVSYGYGMAITPIQLARAYAALANGGKLVRPYVVSEVIDAEGTVLHRNEPKVTGLAVSPRTAQVVTDMLVAAVTEGTGKAAQIRDVSVAGKTGTARKIDPETRKYSRRDYLASFVGYFPAAAPRFVVLVMIDRPRSEYYGGAVAAPVFREIADFLAERAGLRVLPEPVPDVVDHPEALLLAQWSDPVPLAMPSFLGMSLREVLAQATGSGWDLDVEGSGFVVWQDPAPGDVAGAGRTLRLRLAAAHG